MTPRTFDPTVPVTMTVGNPRITGKPLTASAPEWIETSLKLRPFLTPQDVSELADYLELASRRGFGEVTISLRGGEIDLMGLQLTKKKNKSGNSYS